MQPLAFPIYAFIYVVIRVGESANHGDAAAVICLFYILFIQHIQHVGPEKKVALQKPQ